MFKNYQILVKKYFVSAKSHANSKCMSLKLKLSAGWFSIAEGVSTAC